MCNYIYIHILTCTYFFPDLAKAQASEQQNIDEPGDQQENVDDVEDQQQNDSPIPMETDDGIFLNYNIIHVSFSFTA